MATFLTINQFLKNNNIDFKVIELPSVAISVDDVIRLSNGQIKREEIIKTLIVKLKIGEFIGVVLKGEDRLDFQSLGVERLATRVEVLEIADVIPGAVCPILLGIPVVIDKKVTDLKRVNMGSGDHLKGLEMDFDALCKVLSDYQIEEISL